MRDDKEELLQAKRRLALTKYVALVALCAWPLGLLHSAQMSIFIFAVLTVLWGVSTYIAFMHHWAIKNRSKHSQP